jgi:hypothetical protein
VEHFYRLISRLGILKAIFMCRIGISLAESRDWNGFLDLYSTIPSMRHTFSSNAFFLLLLCSPAIAQRQEPVDFNRQIRPILSENCFLCHGFDVSTREADLRLDIREGALADRDGFAAIDPDDLENSELWYRVNTDFKEDRMPPAKTGKSLTAEEIELLGRWIEEGANYAQHWAFAAPKENPLPKVKGLAADNSIDAYILSQVLEAGLSPAPQADRNTLIRRVTLDLTGLPPTPEEIFNFLADERPDAYERLVERLLETSAHAEHMSRFWLDSARYGDTHGLHLDNYRSMYRYRDWLIKSYRENMPYDQFVTEQLAGDLFPDPSLGQRIATGFIRCNPTSAEGGMIAEEFLAKYAMERVDTFGTVFLGMSIACAQCHDHKYDPVTQVEYYQLSAFFNNIAEKASDENIPNPAPFIQAPYPEQVEKLASLEKEVKAKREALNEPSPKIDSEQTRWQEDLAVDLRDDWYVLSANSTSSQNQTELLSDSSGFVNAQGPSPDKEVIEIEASLPPGPWSAFRLEVEPGPSSPTGGVGRSPNANVVLTGLEIESALSGSDDFQRIEIANAVADHSQDQYPSKGVLDDDAQTGWALLPFADRRHSMILQAKEALQSSEGMRVRLRLRFESQFDQHVIGRFRLSATQDLSYGPIVVGNWWQSTFFSESNGKSSFSNSYDPERGIDLKAKTEMGDPLWAEHPEYGDGGLHQLDGEVGSYYLAREVHSPNDRSISLSLGSDDAFKCWLNGELVIAKDVQRGLAVDQDQIELDLVTGSNQLLLKIVNYGGAFGFSSRLIDVEPRGLPASIQQSILYPSEENHAQVRNFYRRRFSPEWQSLDDQRIALEKEQAEFVAQIPTTLVALERSDPRKTYFLNRGQYDDKGKEVNTGVPALFPAIGAGQERAEIIDATNAEVSFTPTRMDLAKWLFQENHPLTSRVQVNRLWQMLFGVGIVKTANDFGAQGEWPSHPELLDWLALEFQRVNWDQRQMIRLMVNSSTYKQDSTWNSSKAEIDPQNRLLARGPRFRLDAEVIRDSALRSSGLLVDRVGGPSVKPYQPDGLWKAVGYSSSNTVKFVADEGEGLYRRSLYTFWKRTSPPPTMSLFDAPTRESCIVQRERTNTPLQALVLWNDVQYVEAARVLAQLMMHASQAKSGDKISIEEGLKVGFLRVLSRKPNADEIRVLAQLLGRQISIYSQDPEGAKSLLQVGDFLRDESLSVEQLAAWTAVASVLLNLDETVTKI